MRINLDGVEIVCAGLPRSGSTLLYRALAGLPPGSTTPKPQTGLVRKTHTSRPELFNSVRVGVFIFGDPVDAVISTRMRRWDQQHFINCEAPEECSPENSDIFREDILNYERMFDSWMQRQSFDLAAVRYETLYQHAPALSKFLGVTIDLPEWKQRTDYSNEVSLGDRAVISRTYERLARKIAAAPNLSFWNAR